MLGQWRSLGKAWDGTEQFHRTDPVTGDVQLKTVYADAANVTVESSAHYDPPRTTSISQPERGSSFSARRPRQAMFVAGR